jgi:predicted RNA-binding Zn-ribbon protein involved in translation (DUF1610 family)
VAIEVTCNACGKTLRTKDSAAGRRAKCPSCGAVIQIPEATQSTGEDILDAEETPFGDLGDPGEWGDATDEESVPGRKPCPMCGEMIKESAAKCRYCGEIFDPALKKRAKKSGAAADIDTDMTTGDWFVAILCSGIGCIAGIIWMIQGKPKGPKMFGVSLLMTIIWNVIRYGIEAANQ